MPKFFNNDMADLAHQLTLSPRRLRLEQIRGIDKLLGIVDADRAYPFDFVCFRITKYRKRRATTGSSVPGRALIDDLVTMAEVISRKANLSINELEEPYRTQQELAVALEVSTKTIRRWRHKGLMGLRMVFKDGVNRLAFLQSTVTRFVKSHEELVAKGASFTQLSSVERNRIVRRARELVAQRPLKLHGTARQIAEETGRAVETVRYTLRRFDEAHRDQAIFATNGSPAWCERYDAVWCCREAGESLASIARAFDCSATDVEAILRRVQIQKWAQSSWEFVHDPLIDAPSAEAIILDAPEPAGAGQRPVRIPEDLPPYLRSLYLTPLLTPAQERDLFRRYNYLKYCVATSLKAFDTQEPTAKQFEGVGELIARTESIKQRIIAANLRLVVSIAKKHGRWSSNFFEVISDGNVSLMRAVERFDYTRGNKFSTYATWAIVKNYARSIPEQHYHYARYVTGQDELLDAAPDHRTVEPSDSDHQRVRELIATALGKLTDREREIVKSHFGLDKERGSVTLEQLGRQFGVTKERIRQIEHRALSRLRGLLAPSLVEALAG